MTKRSAMVLAVTLATMGCGGSGKVPVSGRVLYNGQPLGGATVTFHPDSAGAVRAHAITDADGYYALTTKEDDDGAMVGTYKVTVGKYKAMAKPPVTPEEYIKMSKEMAFKKSLALAESEIPPIYADAQNSPIRLEVPKGGTSNLDISLNKQGTAPTP